MKSKIRRLIFAMILALPLGFIPLGSLGAQDPWKFLEDFTPLPSSLTQISKNYVAVLFENRSEQLVAAVIFKASCFAVSCEIQHRAGYAATNMQGSNTRVYVEPRKSS